MKTPDFIVIGAMKCGTTTLAAQLGAQPGLFMTDPKEPNYFSDDEIFAKGPEWYSSLFDKAPAGSIKGEASTHYTKRPNYDDTLTRMKEAVPEAKLVYMIRSPLSRLVSHYIHAWSEGLLDGPLDADQIAGHSVLIDYGRYGWQIAPYIEAYGRNAVLLTSLERLKQGQTAELSRIAAHLGHTGPVNWRTDLAQENVSAERMRRLPLQKLLIDNGVAAALRRSLVPKSVRQKVREARTMKERPKLREPLRTELIARFLEDREELARYFPDDPTLDLAYPFAGGAA